MSPRPPSVVVTSLLLGLVSATFLVTTAPSASAAARAADSAGADRVGSASYAVPSGAVHVAPWGSDSAAGSSGAPVRTLNRALAVVASGGAIVLRAGTYNEHVQIYKTVTIQNYPGEEVWMEGSVPVTGWVRDGSRWRRDGWTTRFDHSPTYTRGAPDSSQPYWQFVNPQLAPMAAHPDQVWIQGYQQKQAASLGAVGAGSFFLDEATSRLYVGSDPTGKEVRASNIQYAMNIRAPGVVLRGIGVRRFAPSVWQMAAVTIERPNVIFENVHIAEMATTGVSVQSSGAQFRKVTVEWSGMLGFHVRYADGLTINKVLARRNNSEFFNITPVAGGLKMGSTRGVSVTDSNFSDNYGHGFWEDQSIYNSVFRGSNFNRNSGDGLFLEISSRVIVGDNQMINNKLDGIKVNNTNNVKIWNNTITGNSRSLWLAQDSRRNTNRSDPAVDPRVPWPDPEMPWQLDDITVSNNVLGLPGGSPNAVVDVSDYSRQETAESMRIRLNGNVYSRTSASAPTWLTIWSRGSANPAVFTTLAAFKAGTGQEARGREWVGSPVVSSAGDLSSSVQGLSGQIALGLPSDVAAAIGRPAGSMYLGAWGDGGTAPPPTTPPPPPPPTTPPPPPTGGAILAADDFGRTINGGWGTADRGGNWTIPTGSSQFAVVGGGGQMRLRAGDGFEARLSSVSASQVNIRIATSADRNPNNVGHYVTVIGRQVNGVGDYRAKLRIAADGAISVWLLRKVGGTETTFTGTTIPGLSVTTGQALLVRFQVTGSGGQATLAAKAWRGGTAEPGSWAVTATDTTSGLQAAGGVGVSGYSAGSADGQPVTLYFDALDVRS